MYKIETHLHTPHISPCGKLTAEELVMGYKAAGYSALTVTDHYKAAAFRYAGIEIQQGRRSSGDTLCGFFFHQNILRKQFSGNGRNRSPAQTGAGLDLTPCAHSVRAQILQNR